MKISNVNFNFDLSKPTDPQIENLEWVIKQLKQLGIEIVSNNKPSAPAKIPMGSNERLFLRLSGQQRMRTSGTDDREAFAAELVKERYPANIGELVFDSDAAPVAASAPDDTADEEIDGDSLI